MEELLEILNDIKPGVDFLSEKNLVTDKILRSFDVLSLVSEIEMEMGVEIPVEDVVEENFESVDAIMALIHRAQGK